MSKPITSRIKHTTSKGMVKAVGKQTTGQNVELEDAASEALRNVAGYTETENIQGPDKKIDVTKERLSYDQAWDQDVEGIQGIYKDKADYIAKREGQRKNDPVGFEKDLFDKTGVSGGPGTEISQENIPGETKTQTYSGTYRQEDTGTELKPWERRWERRSVRGAGRNLRKSIIRAKRAEARGQNLKGKKYLEFMKNARNEAKKAETTFELEAARGQTKAVEAQVKSSAGDDSKFVIGYSDKDIGSLPLEQQKKIGLERQKAAAKNSAAVMTKSGLKKGYFKNK